MKRTTIGLTALACIILFSACSRGNPNTASGNIETAAPTPPLQSQTGSVPNGRPTLAPTLIPQKPADPEEDPLTPVHASDAPQATPVVDTEKVALLATIVTAALEDGATPEIPTYISGDPIPDDFLYAIVYFYQFCMDAPENQRLLGAQAVLPEISEGAYHIGEADLTRIIQSFFGPMESVNLDAFAQNRTEDGYAFSLSDGPIPKADVLLTEWAGDSLTVNVHLAYVDAEPADIGTLVLGLSADADSILGYAMESFVYMPAAR